jgi:hypothetical protein
MGKTRGEKFDQIISSVSPVRKHSFPFLSQVIGGFVLVLTHEGFNLRRE